MSRTIRTHHILITLIAVLLFIVAGPLHALLVAGDQLDLRTVRLSDSRPATTSNYQFTFEVRDTPLLGSVRFQFCANNPIVGLPCDPPVGFDATPATLTDQSGNTGFMISPQSNTNTLVLRRESASAASNITSYTFSGIQNPATTGSYYVRVEMFTGEDATGSNVEYGGLVFSINQPVNVQAKVPPYLLFCTGVTIQPYDCATAQGDYVDFGELSSRRTSTGQTQLLAATNVDDGYTIRVAGGTLTSGNNVINGLEVGDVSRIGVGQFGLNLRANSTPDAGRDVFGPGQANITTAYSQKDVFRLGTGDPIVDVLQSDDYREFTATYIVNIPKDQAPGIYTTTVSYICLASF